MNQRYKLWRLSLLLAGCLAVVPVWAAVEVAVSILPEKYFVEQIGAEHVSVIVLVGPGQSPATFDPAPRQMSRLAGARLYFRIGVDFEDAWLARIEAVAPGMAVIDLREGITLRQMDRPPGADGPGGGMKDPHVWTNPLLVKRMAATIRDALIQIDPDHAADYRANHARFAAELDALDKDIRTLLAPFKGHRFMVFHPAWGYFADRYGLCQTPIEFEGKTPGARTLNQLLEQARAEGVRMIYVQSQFSRRIAETVAQAIGARVVAVDPLAEDYSANLRRVAQAFAQAMAAP